MQLPGPSRPNRRPAGVLGEISACFRAHSQPLCSATASARRPASLSDMAQRYRCAYYQVSTRSRSKAPGPVTKSAWPGHQRRRARPPWPGPTSSRHQFAEKLSSAWRACCRSAAVNSASRAALRRAETTPAAPSAPPTTKSTIASPRRRRLGFSGSTTLAVRLSSEPTRGPSSFSTYPAAYSIRGALHSRASVTRSAATSRACWATGPTFSAARCAVGPTRSAARCAVGPIRSAAFCAAGPMRSAVRCAAGPIRSAARCAPS